MRSNYATTIKVGLHSSAIQQRPMQGLFIDFMGPTTRTSSGNKVILSVKDGLPTLSVSFEEDFCSGCGQVECVYHYSEFSQRLILQ